MIATGLFLQWLKARLTGDEPGGIGGALRKRDSLWGEVLAVHFRGVTCPLLQPVVPRGVCRSQAQARVTVEYSG